MPLSPESRRAIVAAAIYQAVMSAGADFVSGRRFATLTQADRAILTDLGRRLAARERVVRSVPPRDQEPAAALFAAGFRAGYDAHLSDLSLGRHRKIEQLAHDVLVTLDAIARGRPDC